MNMMEKKLGQKIRVRIEVPELGRAKGGASGKRCTKKKGESVEALSHSERTKHSVKALHHQLELSSKNAARQFTEQEEPKKEKKKKVHPGAAGLKDLMRRTSLSQVGAGGQSQSMLGSPFLKLRAASLAQT